MKLNLETIKNKENWKGYHLPGFDIKAMQAATAKSPRWLHFGSGNIFRAFLCITAQRLLEQGEMAEGIICAESFGTEIITDCFRPHDNLSVSVTLNGDGQISKEVIGSIGESLTVKYDMDRIREVFCAGTLQMVSFTITEKGYAITDAAGELLPVVKSDISGVPSDAKHLMSIVAWMCIERMRLSNKPLALVSMDNCSKNGDKVKHAVLTIAKAWLDGGKITDPEYRYLEKSISYPWTMIDKITPRPDEGVAKQLSEDGVEGMEPYVTPSGIYIAPFVNAERPEYLVAEDDFPAGRPPLEKAGVIFTDRETVTNVEKMKVSTCLNPLHTALAIFGCLLGYNSIAAEMKDEELRSLVEDMSMKEGMPVVVNPGIIDPKAFLDEVLSERLPNPFMPDTPQRIATDTSQKLSVRFGESIKAHMKKGSASDLKLIPLVLAGWLRYLLGVDDQGNNMELSSDPLLEDCREKLTGIALGEQVNGAKLKPLLENEIIFGVNLYKAGLSDKITGYFNELIKAPGAVRQTLKKYLA